MRTPMGLRFSLPLRRLSAQDLPREVEVDLGAATCGGGRPRRRRHGPSPWCPRRTTEEDDEEHDAVHIVSVRADDASSELIPFPFRPHVAADGRPMAISDIFWSCLMSF